MKNVLLAGAVLWLLGATGLFAQTGPKPSASKYPPVSLAGTELRKLQSKIVGDEFHLLVSFPEGYDTAKTAFPVMYVLDGDNDFPYAMEVLGLLKGECGIREPLLVGIGYGAKIGSPGNERFRDYSPTAMKNAPGSGGGPKFLQFLEQELFPMIESNYKVTKDRSLYGYSFGGLFCAYALFEKPELFRQILMGSPALGYGNRAIFRRETAYAQAHQDLPLKVFLQVGAAEQKEHVAATQDMARLLGSRGYPNLQLKSVLLDSAGHLTGKPMAMFKAFEWAYCKSRVVTQVNPKVFEPYAGTYVLGGRDTVVIAAREGKLFATPAGQPPMELLPESETEYFIRESRTTSISFRRDAGGGPVRLFISQGGQPVEAKKIK
jgi:predicted alpha/beta superfamily hydrolase